MSARKESVRLFVGLYPPIEDAKRMLGWLDAVELAPCRPTRPEQVHLTAQFIGNRRVDEIDSIRESVQHAASGIKAILLDPLRLVTLPERGRVKVVAVETDRPPGLLELHRRLATRLARHVRENPSARFRPHFTVCRFQGNAMVDRLDRTVNGLRFTIDQVRLMRSTLGPEGAWHEEIDAIRLS
jgi:2'-5' RNA ligase